MGGASLDDLGSAEKNLADIATRLSTRVIFKRTFRPQNRACTGIAPAKVGEHFDALKYAIRLKCGARGRRGRQPVCAPSQSVQFLSSSCPQHPPFPPPRPPSPTVQHLSPRPTRKPPDVIVRMLTKPGHRHSRLAHKRERKSKCASAGTCTRLHERERQRERERER